LSSTCRPSPPPTERRSKAARTTSRASREARGRGGQGLVEYGLILSLMAVAAVVILVFFGDLLAQILAAIGAAIDRAS
jgi:Flp pilus assembly pilin Flp